MMLPGASRLSSAILVLVRLMESLDIDMRLKFSELGLDYEQLHDSDARFPDEAVIQLWQMLLDKTNDQCAGLRVSDFWHPTSFHALGYAWMASHNLKEAFERLVRYNHFISVNQRFEFSETSSDYRFTFHESEPPYTFPAIFYDAGMSFLKRLCDETYGPGFSFLRVDLKRQEPECAHKFRGRFKAPVVFSAPGNTVYMSKKIVLKPLSTANADLARINEEVVDAYINDIQQGSLSKKVMSRLIERLPSGHVTQEEVAASLFMSARTLQRKLHDEQTSYKALLNETRIELAKRYMASSRSQVSEVAYLLGFSETGNFTRAFKRWTGMLPSEYRARH